MSMLTTAGGSGESLGGADAIGGSSNSASATGGMVATGGASAVNTTSASCNTIDPSVAPWVIPTSVAQESPTPSGGTIVSGTYFQTKETHYTGVGGSTVNDAAQFKSVIVVDGNIVNQAGTDGVRFATWSMSFTISGSSMILQGTCGRAPNGQAAGYSADPSTLKIYVPEADGVMENTFTRQ
jgi:hypothetical protein